MSSKQVFQLTMVSQNDPGCDCGNQLTGEVTSYSGGQLRTGSEPVNEVVKLPVPSADPPPSPTWFIELDGDIADASFEVVVDGPNGSTKITIDGSNMSAWVAANEKEKTNQIYLESACGIFGYAQKNVPAGQDTTYWIYTITAGVSQPMVHPV